jgi:serine/threonine protein kinase
MKDVLGRGGYATVRRTVLNGVEFARKHGKHNEISLDALINEDKLLRAISHPNIIKLLVIFLFILID